MSSPTPVTRFTRLVLALDLGFSLVAGLSLYVLSTRTEDWFAWTIGLPVTATFLGAGYLSAVVLLVPTFRVTSWSALRIVPVMGLTLTSVTLLVTLWHLEPFHLRAGSATARVSGWAWLAVYVAIPVLLAWVFVRQERAGGRDEYARREPLLPLLRAVLVAQAVGGGVLGLGLVVLPGAFGAAWAWPLPELPAGAVGAWLLTIAAGCAWGLHDGDWGRFRVAVPGLAAYLLFVVVGVIRYPEPLDAGAWQSWALFLVIGATGAAFAVGAVQQERLRAPTLGVGAATSRGS